MTPQLYSMTALLVVVVHLGFVVFVLAGGVLVYRWRWIPWFHVPAAAWAIFIELSGGICPLTPLENRLRTAAGLDDYSGDFVARYVFPILYPEGLTREAQIGVGLVVLVINLVLYVAVYRQRRTRIAAG